MEENSKEVQRKWRSVSPQSSSAASNRISDILLSITDLHIFQCCLCLLLKNQFSFSSLPCWALQTGNSHITWHSKKNAILLHSKSISFSYSSLPPNLEKGPQFTTNSLFRGHDRWWTTQNPHATLGGNAFHCLRLSGLRFACNDNLWLMLKFRLLHFEQDFQLQNLFVNT